MSVSAEELLDAAEDFKPAVAHFDTLEAGVARVLSARTSAEARQLAFELSNRVPGLHALGLLLQAKAAERDLLMDRLAPEERARTRLQVLLHTFEKEPSLLRAMAAVHPYSFEFRGAATWEAYRAWLRARRDEPLWGIPDGLRVPLSSVYVSTGYREHVVTASGHRDERERWKRAEVEAAGDPLRRLLALCDEPGDDVERLIFVTGAPGAGKSSLAKMLSAALAEDPRVQPVLIRLREVRPEHDLFEEIALQLRDVPGDGEIAVVLPWAPRLVLLLDGFDELINASRVGVGGFFLRLREALRDGRVHAAVCLGRDTVFDSRDTELPGAVRVLSLKPFTPEQTSLWCSKWNAAAGAAFDAKRFLEGDEVSRALVSEPLPLFLIALLDREGRLPSETGGGLDLATVYRALIHATCQRHEDGRKDGSAATLRRFLRVLGIAVVQSGAELIRLPELARALRATGISLDVSEAESKATGLILAISHRRSHQEERAWEFIHRSLGEYLAAEFLAAEVPNLVATETDEFDQKRYRLDEAKLTQRWIERFGLATIPVGVERFLVRMAGDWPAFVKGSSIVEEDRDVAVLAERLGEAYQRLTDEDDAETVLAVARAWGMRPSEVLENSLSNVFLAAGLRAPSGYPTRFNPKRWGHDRFARAVRFGGLDRVVERIVPAHQPPWENEVIAGVNALQWPLWQGLWDRRVRP